MAAERKTKLGVLHEYVRMVSSHPLIAATTTLLAVATELEYRAGVCSTRPVFVVVVFPRGLSSGDSGAKL